MCVSKIVIVSQLMGLCVLPSGTRNAILNTEARTVEAEVLSRRCIIMRLAEFSYELYQKALRQSAGAVVIILPKNMSAMPQDIVQVITLTPKCCLLFLSFYP